MIAYVDGFNLYYGMKAKYGRRFLWLDLPALARALRPDDQLLTVRYFTTVVRGEVEAADNQRTYLAALEAHDPDVIEVRRGWFSKSRPICGTCRERWSCGCPKKMVRYTEKETDVALASHLVADSRPPASDVALIISADSDFVPAVAIARELAPQRQIFLALPPGNMNPHANYRDVGHFYIPRHALRDAQLPETVIGADGTKHRRPQKWAAEDPTD